WIVPCKMTQLSAVVTRKQVGAQPRLLHPDLLLILLRSRRPDRPLWLSVLRGPVSPLLLWLVLKGGSLWAQLHQAKPLRGTARRSRRRCLSLLLCLVSQVGVLLYDSPID